ncbi:MAG: hypothetical protein ACPG31_06330 [Planctomycetota bacterium]
MLLPFIQTFILAFFPTQVATEQAVVAVDANTQAVVAAAPELWFAIPAEGETGSATVLVGTNFGDFPIPFFGLIPSVPGFTFSTPRIPFVGRISIMATVVPFSFFGGNVDLTVVSDFQTSNSIPFRIL